LGGTYPVTDLSLSLRDWSFTEVHGAEEKLRPHRLTTKYHYEGITAPNRRRGHPSPPQVPQGLQRPKKAQLSPHRFPKERETPEG